VLDEQERERIRVAVAAAEAASGAEIVPVLVPASDHYLVADWRGAAFGSWIGAAALVACRWRDPWSGGAAWWPLAAALLGALGGFLVARIPALRRRLAGGSALDRAVEAGARAAFVGHAVFRTRDATGILLYVSLFERQVRVIADEGVYRAVAPEIWSRVAADVASRMKQAPPAEALMAAVGAAGRLVAEHGPRRRSDDRDELPDEPSVDRA
jgi:putative membrane protein